MMSYQIQQAEAPFWHWWRTGLRTIAILLSSAVVGGFLIALTWRFGAYAPAIVIGLALVPLAIVLTINDARVALLILFASFLFGFRAITLGGFDIQMVDIAVLVVTVLVVLQRLATRKPPISWAAPLVWAAGILIWAVISMTSAIDQSVAVKQLGSLASGLTLAMVVLTLSRRMEDVRFMSTALVIFATAVVIPSLGQAGSFRSYHGGTVVEGRLTGLFNEPNELGVFCSMTALIAAGLLLGTHKLKLKLLFTMILTVLVAGLMLSLSRGAWLGVGVGAVMLLVTLPAARRMLVLAAVPLTILGLVVSSLVPSTPTVEIVGQRLQALVSLDSPYDDRPEIYEEAVRQVRQDPWTGQGPANFSVAAQRLASNGVVVTASHAHNAYLNIAAELGIPALIMLAFFIAAMFRRARGAIRTARANEQLADTALLAGLAAALLANVTTGFFNNFFGNPIIESVQWSAIGMILGGHRALGLERDSGRYDPEAVGPEVPLDARSALELDPK